MPQTARKRGRAAASGVKSLQPMLARARTLPIQRSVDVAVPIEVADIDVVDVGLRALISSVATAEEAGAPVP
jgi:hypothetical protein